MNILEYLLTPLSVIILYRLPRKILWTKRVHDFNF